MKQYGGALVEEFIAGREFTVLVVEEPVGGPAEGAHRPAATTTATITTTSTYGDAAGACVNCVALSGSTITNGAAYGHVNGQCSGRANGAPETASAADAASELGAATTGAKAGTSAAGDPDALPDPDAPPFRAVSYMPVECVFGPGEDFKHFDLKWHDYESCSWKPCDEPQLAEELKVTNRAPLSPLGRGPTHGSVRKRITQAESVTASTT